MDDAKKWRWIDLALAIVAANTSVIGRTPSRPVPMRRFIISQEEDATRP